VLDFGIGKALTAAQRDETEGRITGAGVSLGTPTYIAPEQASGDPSLDHRADIYALGVVAYEMVAGHPPFRGRTPQATMAAHARDEPEPLAARRSDVPPHLARIVMRCLAKAPADRPSSAADIVRALALGTVVAESPARSTLSRIPMWVPWLLAAVSTAAAVTLAITRK
jgi:eukaryotic-like serine/threonine-protein kinase